MDKTTQLNDGSLLYLYLKAIARYRNLTAAEEAKLAPRIRKGDNEALTLLVQANLRFVVNVAKAYQNQGLPLADLINEGNLGLIKAARRFDDRKNFKFITYAVWWIRQAILKALAEQSRIVKLPLNRVGTLYKIGKAQLRLEQAYHRLPGSHDIARELGIPEREVADTLRIGNTAVSFDSPLQDDGSASLLDCMPDDRVESPDENMNVISLDREIDTILNDLDKREREVLTLYFGIGDETPCTLEEIGKRFKLTRERARQLKQKALTRLRGSSRKPQLRSFIH